MKFNLNSKVVFRHLNTTTKKILHGMIEIVLKTKIKSIPKNF